MSKNVVSGRHLPLPLRMAQSVDLESFLVMEFQADELQCGGNGNFRDRIKVYEFSLSFLVADCPMFSL